MSSDTLLAHLSNRFGQGAENLATEALQYVLRHPQVANGFERHVRQFTPDLPPLGRYRTQVGGDSDAGIRDLVGTTADNTTPLVVEVKFDAPLTPNQPVTYLTALAELRSPALLLFLVPTTRVTQLWPRLLRRCAVAGLNVAVRAESELVARFGTATMAVTTWSQLLDDVTGIPLSEQNQQVLSEIQQLRGLCAREDRSGFRPFGSEFLEGDTGRHLLNLDSLLVEAIEVLRGEGTAVTSGYKWTASRGWFGKYFALAGRQVLLHANFRRWGLLADTPLWIRVYPGSDPRVGDALGPLRAAEPRRLFDDDGKLQVPVFLPPDGDRDECVGAIVAAARQVRDLLAVVPALLAPDPPQVADRPDLEEGLEQEAE